MKGKIGFISFNIQWPILCIFFGAVVLTIWELLFLIIPLMYISLFLHEGAHAWSFKKFGKARTCDILISGVMKGVTTANLQKKLTNKEQVICLIAGPLAGIFWGFLCVSFSILFSLGIYFILGCMGSVLLHIYNLLPIKKTSDGYKIRHLLREK